MLNQELSFELITEFVMSGYNGGDMQDGVNQIKSLDPLLRDILLTLSRLASWPQHRTDWLHPLEEIDPIRRASALDLIVKYRCRRENTLPLWLHSVISCAQRLNLEVKQDWYELLWAAFLVARGQSSNLNSDYDFKEAEKILRGSVFWIS